MSSSMFSPTSRLVSRRGTSCLLHQSSSLSFSAQRARSGALRLPHGSASRRTLFTTPAQKSRSWKSSFARWGVAGGGLYWYMNWNPATNAEDDAVYYATSYLPTTEVESETLPTLDALAAARRQRLATASFSAPADAPRSMSNVEATSPASLSPEASGDTNAAAALEEEAEGEGAFNPETGEINWDCPCLGGMAYGPCGEDFRTAFSCFVYSTVEPKGMDCIENFKKMQDCFRQHPDVYGAELADDGAEYEDGEDGEALAVHKDSLAVDVAGAPVPGEEVRSQSIPEVESKTTPKASEKPATKETQPQEGKSAANNSATSSPSNSAPKSKSKSKSSAKNEPKQGTQALTSTPSPAAVEPEEGVPRVWHDATAANEKFKAETK